MTTRIEAMFYCTRRWHSQCELFPAMRVDIPLALYVRVNLKATMKLLAPEVSMKISKDHLKALRAITRP
jgi:hypothetical protein